MGHFLNGLLLILVTATEVEIWMWALSSEWLRYYASFKFSTTISSLVLLDVCGGVFLFVKYLNIDVFVNRAFVTHVSMQLE